MTDIPSGWPCASLPTDPPSVFDLEAQPSADSLLPQIAGVLTPRGPAFGTDEMGDGRGASPVQLGFWRGLAAWVAGHLGLDWQAATQTFPSAVTYTLPDWERELGLPGSCGTAQGGTEARLAAVRARFAAQGGQSPAYFVCVAAAAGYTITIEEPTQVLIDVSEVGPDVGETWFLIDDGAIEDTPLEAFVWAGDAAATGLDELAGEYEETWFTIDDGQIEGDPLEGFNLDDPRNSVWKYWIIHLQALGETWFTIDDGVIEQDPLEGFVPASDLECLLRGLVPPHTVALFDYAG